MNVAESARRAITLRLVKKSKMYDIAPEKLIRAVKARPALYSKNEKFVNGHKKTKARVWKDLFQEINPNWDQMAPLERAEYGREIQKRWKSLRTCFTRELALQKKEKSTPKAERVKKRKVYEYFNALSFILEHTDVNVEGNDQDIQESENESDYQGQEAPCEFGESSHTDDLRNVEIKIENEIDNYVRPEIIYDGGSTLHDRIFDVLKSIKTDENDDDRQFMLSLIPSFRKIRPRNKLEAKIEMMKVIQKYQEDF